LDILPTGTKSLLEKKESKLPDGVKYISISLLNVLASTTIIIFQFRFDDNASRRLEYPINKKCSTYTRKIKNGTQYITPFHQKQEALKKVKHEIVSECKLWVKNNLGGFYTSNKYSNSLPYCEFITLEKNEPYTKSKFLFDYQRLLNLDYSVDVWSSEELQGIYLTFSVPKNESCPVVKIVGRTKDILENFDTKLHLEKTIESFVHYLEHFDKTLVIFCLYYLQRFYKNQVFKIRDDIGSIKIKNIRKSSNDLKKNADRFAMIDMILPFYENDLLELCNNNSSFIFNTYIFRRKNKPDSDIQLFNEIRKYLINDANSLLQTHNNLRQSFITISNIINSLSNDQVSKANFRTQITIVILSAIMISRAHLRELPLPYKHDGLDTL